MEYNDILAKVTIAEKNWDVVKFDHGVCPESKKFLKGSYLVASHASVQIDPASYSSNLRDTVLNNKGILKEIETNQHYLKICKEYARLEKKLKNIKPEDERKKAVDDLKIIRTEFDDFNLSQLDFSDDFCVELRFPGIRMEIIQQIKKHPLVYASLTCCCAACIRVVLQMEFPLMK